MVLKDSRTLSGVAVVIESVWDIGWHWPAQYFDRYSRLGEFTEVVNEGQTMGGPQIVEVLDLKTVIAEAIDWNWSRQCMDRTLRLDALAWAVALIIWLGRLAQVFKMKRDANRLTLYEDSWASCLVATGDIFFCLSDSIRLRWLHIIKGVIERRT